MTTFVLYVGDPHLIQWMTRDGTIVGEDIVRGPEASGVPASPQAWIVKLDSREFAHALEKLADWFELVNQKFTNARDGLTPPSYDTLWTDAQDGLRHVGYLLEICPNNTANIGQKVAEASGVPASPYKQALQNLVAKLEQIHADPQYQSVWTLSMIHGAHYSGPTYEAELNAAKRVLADPPGAIDTPK